MTVSLLGIVTKTMTVLRPPAETDGYGTTRPGQPTSTSVPGCLFHLLSSVSPLDNAANRYADVDKWELIAPPGSTVQPDDIWVDPDGYRYAVIGRPQPQGDPALGIDHGVLATLRRVG